ncbi:MAG: hypothetical protein GX573_04060 [Chloroflexi bacterium]|nr:hypothetical protein [Chloroflexota bacterium]
MKNMLFSTLSWIVSDPRHTLAVLFIVMMVLALATAVVPTGVVLGADITSGS